MVYKPEDILKQLKEEKITIGKGLTEINQIIFRYDNAYLASQTYFLLYSDLEPGNLFQILNSTKKSN